MTNITGIFTAIKGAGFKGKLILEGTYDAYGNDYGTGELLPEVERAGRPTLNAEESKTCKKGP